MQTSSIPGAHMEGELIHKSHPLTSTHTQMCLLAGWHALSQISKIFKNSKQKPLD